MRFIDKMIVKAAKAILGGIMTLGTVLVYIKLFALMIFLAMALAVILMAMKAAIFGA